MELQLLREEVYIVKVSMYAHSSDYAMKNSDSDTCNEDNRYMYM